MTSASSIFLHKYDAFSDMLYSVDALRLLLSHGADKERRNEDRLTALDLAESVGAVRAQSYLHGG